MAREWAHLKYVSAGTEVADGVGVMDTCFVVVGGGDQGGVDGGVQPYKAI